MSDLKTILDLQRALSTQSFQHFAIGRNADGVFQASYRGKGSEGYTLGISDDLSEAITTCLSEYSVKEGRMVTLGDAKVQIEGAAKRISKRDGDDLI